MNRRVEFLIVGVFCLCAASSLISCGPPTKSKHQNVVLIVVDALRQDRVNAQRDGVPVMPCLAGLSDDSLCFTRAYAPCSWTKPAMVSVLTSLHADAHQVCYSGVVKKYPKHMRFGPQSLEFMAEFLADRGYDTACVQTNPHLTREMGIAQGFNHYQYLALGAADAVSAASIEMLDDLEEPFFLYVHYIDPHAPYWPPESYRTLFCDPSALDPEELATLHPDKFNDYVSDATLYQKGWVKERQYPSLSDAGRKCAVSFYDGEARFADEQIARLLHALGPVLSRSVLVVTADHGEELWERGQSGHGSTLYEEVVHVPLMFKGAGVPAQKVASPVETIDILPTVAQILGLEPAAWWQGRSLLHGPWPQDRPVYAQTRGSLPIVNVSLDMALRDTSKLVLDRLSMSNSLYDVASGVDVEMTSAPAIDGVRASLEGLLNTHRDECAARASELGIGADEAGADADPESVSEEAKEALDALGYL